MRVARIVQHTAMQRCRVPALTSCEGRSSWVMTAFEAMHARPGEESPGGETRAHAHVKSERTSPHRDNDNGLSELT
jgi:hypothetical protein